MRIANVALCVLIAGSLAATACTSAPRPSDPFASGGASSRQGPREFRVRLEVGCDKCAINYTVGPRTERLQVGAGEVWSRTFRRFPLMPEAIRLTAAVTADGGPVSSVRIYVDGDLVAEAGCGGCVGVGGLLEDDRRTHTVETVIPPRS